MNAYEVISLILAFGLLLVSLISLIIKLIKEIK